MSRLTPEVQHVASPRDQTGQKVTISVTSAQSTAFTGIQYVDVVTDTACFIEVGENPTAVVDTSYRLSAETPTRIKIAAGDKIAVVGTTGNLWLHPVG